ncbi:MAG: tetratricopeptide repeat protein [Desulfuromonadaceae bacterium]
MRFFSLISAAFSAALLLPLAAGADVRLFTGSLEVVTASGKSCAGRKGNYQISLVIGSGDADESILGYVGGDKVTVGQLRGPSLGALSLRYPYPDPERAEGHTIRVEASGATLRGELRDIHLDASMDGCNFDLARISLVRTEGDEAATLAYQRLSRLFEAQLARATAIAISRSGEHAGAVHVFEKALALADNLYPPDSKELIPYLTSLANSYMHAGRYLDFSALYNSRIATLHDGAVQMVFGQYQIRSLLQLGRAALGREEYQTALGNFRQALRIDYKNKEAIEATLSALVLSGRHDEAIAFLEETEQKLEGEPDRHVVRDAIALIVYRKAMNEQKSGLTAEAERSLRKAIKLDPDTVHYLVVLARWVHKAGNYSEADALLKRGLDSFRDEPRRRELSEAREKLRQMEKMLVKIRRGGS